MGFTISVRQICKLPGGFGWQLLRVQRFLERERPLHFLPPFLARILTVRFLVLVPDPHVLLHELHLDHRPQAQSLGLPVILMVITNHILIIILIISLKTV